MSTNNTATKIRMHLLLPLAVAMLTLAGCNSVPQKQQPEVDPKLSAYQMIRERLIDGSKTIGRYQDEVRNNLEQGPALQGAPIEPLLPSFDPLGDQLISISLDNEDVRHLLRAVAEEAGLNLLIDPALSSNPRPISVHFRDTPASQVLNWILESADLHSETRGNTLFITPFQTAVFHLDFVESQTTASFDAGGDVLGSASTSQGSTSSLTGNFRISGKSGNITNPYDSLQTSIKALLSAKGKADLNALSGTLYVRDKPSVVRNVEKLVSRYQKIVGSQVLIEARILEVRLADGYEFGIDWSLLREALGGTVGFSSGISQVLSNDVFNPGANPLTISSTPGPVAPQAGLVFSNLNGNNSTLFAATLLEAFGEVQLLSNPTIRARHAQPAMISVGQSNTYIKETKITQNTSTVVGNGTVSTEIKTDTVFDGLLLGVIPFIGEDGRVSLSIHPIKSEVDLESLKLVTIQNVAISLPKVNLEEISTTVKLHNGETVMLGGLISDMRRSTDSGFPGRDKLGVLGKIFGREDDLQETRELVVVLRVSVI